MEVYFRLFNNPITIHSTAIEIGNFTVQWYGVLIAFGFLLAVLFGGRMAYKWKMNLDSMVDVLIGGTIGGVVGARLYYVLFNLSAMNNFLDIFRIWEGGMAIYGGIIGGLLGAFIVTRFNKLNFLNLMDLAAMSFLIGQGIGRWGNFTNQEAFGANTNLPWGMWSQATANYINAHQGMFAQHGIEAVAGTVLDRAYVHPTFLYESLWVLLGFGLIYLFCRKWRSFSGQLILLYGMWYGAGRFFIESLRLDPLFIGSSNVRVSQLLSGLIVLGCAAAFVYFTLHFNKNPKPIEGIDFFPGSSVELELEAAEEEIATDDADTVEEIAADEKMMVEELNEESEDEPIA